MLTNLVSKVIGPKVLMGLSVASTITVVFLVYLLMNAKERAVQAEAERRELVQTVKEQSVELSYIRAQNERRERAINQAITAQEKAEATAESINNELSKELANDKCAQSSHPDAVSDSLQFQPFSSNQD